jgi:peptidyl-prolyl cis-trans isomerase SurA
LEAGVVLRNAWALNGPGGEIRLQVEWFLPALTRRAGPVLICGALLAGVSGCHRSPAPDVMATVNGKEILRGDLERKYQAYKSSQGATPQEPSAEQVDLAKLAVLRQMIEEEILEQRAAKLNVTASDEDVNAKLTEMKALNTEEEFEQKLKQSDETLDNLKTELRRGLTVTKLLNKEIDSKINITDAEITGYYSAHKADFNFIEPRYNLARIVVTNAPAPRAANLQNNKATGDADAKNKIQTLFQKLENGEDFSVLAANYSEDNFASNGGDMGFVTESQLHEGASPEVYDAITKLKPGQFTPVLPSSAAGPPSNHKPSGYAIYRLLSKEAAGQRTLSDPSTQQFIRQSLRDGHAELLKNAYFEVLRDDAKIHNYLADQILRDGAK